MAKITFSDGLPFVEVTVKASGKSITLPHVLIDTGSAACAFKTDDMEKLDIRLELTDRIVFLTGIGDGREAVVKKQVESIEAGDVIASSFIVQVGALDHGYGIDGILGADFLRHTRAVLDFDTLEVRKK